MNNRRFNTPVTKISIETTPVGKKKIPSSSIEKRVDFMEAFLTQIPSRFVEQNVYSKDTHLKIQ